MVDVIGRAKVIISGDVDSRSIDSAGGKIGNSLKRGAVVGVAALGTLAVGAVKVYKEFEEAESVSRKLNNVLDNMGKGGAAPAVEKLTDELRKLTGVDDEVIKGGQTILATFESVAESAGEMGGTFDRATRLSVDMASVFGSVESGARILGKALGDPEKAAARLMRANIVLSEEQKTLIDNFVAAGDAAGAQDVILSALEDRYKGTAEVGATESAKIASAWEEIKESLGGMVEELITGDDASGSFADSLERVNDELKEFSESEGWETAKTAIRGIGIAFDFAGEFLSEWSESWQNIGANTGMVVDDFVARFHNMRTDIADDWHVLKQNVGDTIDDIQSDIRNAPATFKRRVGEWKSAGTTLIRGFIDGLSGGSFSAAGAIAQKIKDAINKSLPDSLTFFGGKGGIPAITVDLPQLATGARNFRGGLAVVGETGPELVSLPAGSDVYSNSESRGMASGGGNTNIFNITGPTSLAELRQQADWYNTYGTRFGGST